MEAQQKGSVPSHLLHGLPPRGGHLRRVSLLHPHVGGALQSTRTVTARGPGNRTRRKLCSVGFKVLYVVVLLRRATDRLLRLPTGKVLPIVVQVSAPGVGPAASVVARQCQPCRRGAANSFQVSPQMARPHMAEMFSFPIAVGPSMCELISHSLIESFLWFHRYSPQGTPPQSQPGAVQLPSARAVGGYCGT